MHDKLKKYFEEKGITQQQIADALDVSLQYVNQILNGKKSLGKKNAERLANLFGLSKSFLLTGEGDLEYTNNEQYKQIYDDTKETIIPPSFDFSLMIEHAVKAATSYADQTIATLKSQLADKDKMLADKDDLITTLKSRIRNLELTIANNSLSDIEHYPFHIGAADGENEQQRINHI